jgi:Ferric iron reductase FhuF-like transporter
VQLKDISARAGEVGAPYARWQYAERYLGGGTRTYSRYAADLEIAPQFHPQHGTPRFDVPTFWVDPERGRYLVGAIPSALHRRYRSGESFLLPVHPETLTEPAVRDELAGCRPGPPIEVVPSANARTVFVVGVDRAPVEPHFLKLHYPKRLSRFTRRLRWQVIALQLWVAEELWRVDAPFLPEVGGGVLGHDPVEAWGFLVREARVRDASALPVTVPLFALYGHDVRAPADPSLLEQLVDHSGQSAEAWITGRLIEPMISLFVDVLLRTGCALELHGQNTLLCLGDDLRSTRLAYRDCAIYVDPAIRADRGLTRALPPRNVISLDVRKPREQVFSLVYDCFLGHHTLDFIARLAAERFGVDPAALHRFARRAFADRAGGEPLLPPTVYYYDDQLHAGGEWRLVDTGAPPRWR